MRLLFLMFVTSVCVLFLLKLRWPKTKSIYGMKLTFFGRSHFRIHGQFLKVSAQHLSKTTQTRKQEVFNQNDSRRLSK